MNKTDKSIFEKIADGEIPGHIIWQNEKHMAFLDINPLSKGHCLVVPKKNIGDYIFEIDNNQYNDLMRATKEVALLLKNKLVCDRVLVMVEGFAVPHVHVHLIPTQHNVGFENLKHIEISQEELQEIYQQIVN